MYLCPGRTFTICIIALHNTMQRLDCIVSNHNRHTEQTSLVFIFLQDFRFMGKVSPDRPELKALSRVVEFSPPFSSGWLSPFCDRVLSSDESDLWEVHCVLSIMAWNGRQFPNYALPQNQQRYNYEHYEQEETDAYEAQQQDANAPSDHYAAQASGRSSATAPSKTDPSWPDDRATMLQSLAASQVEDAAELRQVFPPQNEAYPDASSLPAIPEHQPFQPRIRLPQLPCGTPYYYTSLMVQPATPMTQPTYPQAMDLQLPGTRRAVDLRFPVSSNICSPWCSRS
jgi:hypothetical protein